MTSSDLKSIIDKHNRLASEAMSIEYDTGNLPLVKYKNFIDNTEVIKDILKDVVVASKTAPKLFEPIGNRFQRNGSENEIEDLAIQYKEITTLVKNDVNIRNYAEKIFVLEFKKSNDYIHKLLSLCLMPLVKYIRENLNNKLYGLEENEKIQMVIHGDYINGDQQKGNKKAVIKQNKKFQFNTENFLLGIASTVIAEVIILVITEFIKFIAK